MRSYASCEVIFDLNKKLAQVTYLQSEFEAELAQCEYQRKFIENKLQQNIEEISNDVSEEISRTNALVQSQNKSIEKKIISEFLVSNDMLRVDMQKFSLGIRKTVNQKLEEIKSRIELYPKQIERIFQNIDETQSEFLEICKNTEENINNMVIKLSEKNKKRLGELKQEDSLKVANLLTEHSSRINSIEAKYKADLVHLMATTNICDYDPFLTPKIKDGIVGMKNFIEGIKKKIPTLVLDRKYHEILDPFIQDKAQIIKVRKKALMKLEEVYENLSFNKLIKIEKMEHMLNTYMLLNNKYKIIKQVTELEQEIERESIRKKQLHQMFDRDQSIIESHYKRVVESNEKQIQETTEQYENEYQKNILESEKRIEETKIDFCALKVKIENQINTSIQNLKKSAEQIILNVSNENKEYDDLCLSENKLAEECEKLKHNMILISDDAINSLNTKLSDLKDRVSHEREFIINNRKTEYDNLVSSFHNSEAFVFSQLKIAKADNVSLKKLMKQLKLISARYQFASDRTMEESLRNQINQVLKCSSDDCYQTETRLNELIEQTENKIRNEKRYLDEVREVGKKNIERFNQNHSNSKFDMKMRHIVRANRIRKEIALSILLKSSEALPPLNYRPSSTIISKQEATTMPGSQISLPPIKQK